MIQKIRAVFITPSMLAEATIKARAIPPLSNSFRKGKGNVIGMLGQLIIGAYCQKKGIPCEDCSADSTDCDLIILGSSCEVKSKEQTIDCAPLDTWSVSVENASLHQKPDFYVFARIYKRRRGRVGDEVIEYPYGWVVGVYPRQSYVEDAIQWRKGEFDPENNKLIESDRLNMPIGKLTGFDEWVRALQKEKGGTQ